MDLPKPTTTVTPFSKILALILFVVLPFVGFFLGQSYGKMSTNSTGAGTCPKLSEKTSTCAAQKACSEEAKECPDGSFVFREQPNCEFAACSSLTAAENERVSIAPSTPNMGASKEEQITTQLSQKTGITSLDLIITYKKDSPETTMYAGGTYVSKKRGTAGRFIASKINGAWQVTSISSGIPLCSDVTPYFYPKDLVPACKDGKGNITAR